jgi:hypothetical protein
MLWHCFGPALALLLALVWHFFGTTLALQKIIILPTSEAIYFVGFLI